MDDLIKRLENGLPAMKTVMGGYTLDLDTAQAERMEAATALAEAQATIARQQVMLDRALESNGDMMGRIGKLEEALRVAEQDFYSASNMWRDEDYEGPHEKFTVPVVCYAKPYFDMHMKHLADSAERAALAQGKGE